MDVKKESILFTLPSLNGGGAERVMINIIKTLDQSKFDIKLLLVDKIGVFLDLVPDYVEILSLDIKRTRNALPALIKHINAIQPDIIFSTINRMNILVLMASFFIPKTIKIYVREPSLPSAQKKYLPFSQRIWIKFLYPKAYKIVAQTDEMADEIHQHFGIKKDKIITLINPIDKEFIDKSLQNITNPFDENYINLVAVGRLSHEKGFDVLIKAMSEVLKVDDKYRLYIVGEGKDRVMLEELIKHFKLEKNIFLLGFHNNPYKYIKYANAFILSSRWEGLPNVVLESLYIGTPVVATKVVKLLEQLIEDGKNGFLVDLNGEDFRQRLLCVKQLHANSLVSMNNQDINKILDKD